MGAREIKLVQGGAWGTRSTRIWGTLTHEAHRVAGLTNPISLHDIFDGACRTLRVTIILPKVFVDVVCHATQAEVCTCFASFARIGAFFAHCSLLVSKLTESALVSARITIEVGKCRVASVARSALYATGFRASFAFGIARLALVLLLEGARGTGCIAIVVIQDVVAFHRVALEANVGLPWSTL